MLSHISHISYISHMSHVRNVCYMCVICAIENVGFRMHRKMSELKFIHRSPLETSNSSFSSMKTTVKHHQSFTILRVLIILYIATAVMYCTWCPDNLLALY